MTASSLLAREKTSAKNMASKAGKPHRAVSSRRARTRKRTSVGLRYLVMIIMFLVAVGPFLWQLSTSLKGLGDDIYSNPPQLLPSHLTFSNYAEVTRVVPVWTYAWNSIIVAVITVAGNLIGSTCAGYALASMRFKGRKLAMGVFFAAMLVPAEVIIISQFLQMQAMGLNNTLIAVVLPGLVAALNVLLMYNGFLSIPGSIEEAALLDGANSWQRFRLVALPNVRGTMAVVSIFAFVGQWNNFLWPLIVLTDQSKYTLTVGMNYLQGAFTGNPRVVAAGTVVAVLPLVILFFALQRYFFRGVGEGGVKG